MIYALTWRKCCYSRLLAPILLQTHIKTVMSKKNCLCIWNFCQKYFYGHIVYWIFVTNICICPFAFDFLIQIFVYTFFVFAFLVKNINVCHIIFESSLKKSTFLHVFTTQDNCICHICVSCHKHLYMSYLYFFLSIYLFLIVFLVLCIRAFPLSDAVFHKMWCEAGITFLSFWWLVKLFTNISSFRK